MYPLLSVSFKDNSVFGDFTASKRSIVLFQMPPCLQNQVCPPLAELGFKRGRRTLCTRLPMVSMCRASESLVRAWAKSYIELEEDCPCQ